MNRKNFSYKMKKNLALGMAALTTFGTIAGTAVTAHAEPTEEVAEANNLGDPLPGMAQALIKKGIGTIPVVGETIADILDPLFGELLGDKSDDSEAIIGKLQELSEKINELDLKMDENTQKILDSMYEHGLDGFNNDITSIREIEVKLFKKIAKTKGDDDLTELQKALEIGVLLDTNSTDTAEFVNKLNTCAAYVQGTQVDSSHTEGGIFMKAFKIKCAQSKLGGEAAMKASDYINNVDKVIENGYKLETMILDAKMVARQILANMSDPERTITYLNILNKYGAGSKELILFHMCKNSAEKKNPATDSTMNTWKEAAGIMENGHYTGAKGKYELICNSDNPESVAGRYNAYVTQKWFDYIEKATVDGKTMTVEFQPLSKELEGSDYKDLNLEQFNNKNTFAVSFNSLLVNEAINNRFNNDSKSLGKPVYQRRTDVLSGNKAQQLLASLKTLEQYKGKTDIEILKDYGFDVTTTLKENSERYGVSAQDVNNLSEKELVDATKPIIVYNAKVDQNNVKGVAGNCVNMDGNNLSTNADETTKVYTEVFGQKTVLDPTYHKLLSFSCAEEPVTLTDDEANNTANTAELDAQIEAGFKLDPTIDSTPAENPENNDNKDNKDKTDESIVLTVDENGQISGDKMNEAWSVAEDGTIILNKDNKFRFEGTVTDKKIQNNGEIVDGNFKNVKLELVDNAVIKKGTFEECEITTNENAVIGEEVEFINTTVIDAKDIGNPEEEEQKKEQEENQQDVVEETPVVENDMF